MNTSASTTMTDCTVNVAAENVTGKAVLANAGAFWSRLAEAWYAYCRYKRDLHDLQAMSDRMLADIGVSRSEIKHALRFGRDTD